MNLKETALNLVGRVGIGPNAKEPSMLELTNKYFPDLFIGNYPLGIIGAEAFCVERNKDVYGPAVDMSDEEFHGYLIREYGMSKREATAFVEQSKPMITCMKTLKILELASNALRR